MAYYTYLFIQESEPVRGLFLRTNSEARVQVTPYVGV